MTDPAQRAESVKMGFFVLLFSDTLLGQKSPALLVPVVDRGDY